MPPSSKEDLKTASIKLIITCDAQPLLDKITDWFAFA
jgi:hypothetical protein